jgi:hypothetical protein
MKTTIHKSNFKYPLSISLFLIGVFIKTQAQEFKPLRYNEDFSILKNDTNPNFYKRLKYTPLSKNRDFYLTTGGEVRLQHQFFRNEEWGEEPSDTYGFLLTRTMLHADARLGKNIRLFGQLTSNFEMGRAAINKRGIDQNPLDVHQVFIDIKSQLAENQTLTFRVGRQELLYGSQRLVATREGPNVRQTFDGMKVFFQKKNLQVDGLMTWFVPTQPIGIFNDPFDTKNNQRLWGIYAVKNQVPIFENIDLYYLGYHNPLRRYDEGTATETRHSIGTRIWGKNGAWTYDYEAVAQFGTFGSRSIEAWTVSTNNRYKVTGNTTLGFKTELISGDQQQGDNRLQSFNPLFPRGGYFGLAALVSPSNLFDIHPSVSIELTPKISIEADYDAFWRLSQNDGLYGPVGQLIRSGQTTDSRFIGYQWSAMAEYKVNPFFKFDYALAFFKTGNFLKESGASSNLFFMVTTATMKF